MRKILWILFVFILDLTLTSCPGDSSVTYKTIETVQVHLYSFGEYGLFPYTDKYNKNELGIGIYPDSINERIEIAQSFSLVKKAMAMEDPNRIIFTNTIDSLNIITLYKFDKDHLAGSNINDILLVLDIMGDTQKKNINTLSSVSHDFKFSAIPEHDTLQFEISGRISDGDTFNLKTELIIIE